MEAGDESLDRAKANLRKAVETWVSVPANAKPNTQPWSGCSGGGVARNPVHLTRGGLLGSATHHRGRWEGQANDPPTCQENPDRPVVAWKPGNAGGAKGATE